MKTKFFIGVVAVCLGSIVSHGQTLLLHGVNYSSTPGGIIDVVVSPNSVGAKTATSFDGGYSFAGYVGGSFSQVTSDVNNGTALEKYIDSRDQFTTVPVSGSTSIPANNIFRLVQGPTGYISYAVLDSGYNGSGNGVNLGNGAIHILIRQTSGSETDLAIGGTFAGAGGYTNNGSFAVYRDGYNGWADYFYYPSAALPSGTADAWRLTTVSGGFHVTGTSITAFWDQYGDHPGSQADWNIGAHYFTNIQ